MDTRQHTQDAEDTTTHDTARRILNLLFILNSSSTPLTTEQIVSDSDLGYGSPNRASDLKKFKRDREKLAERGIHIIEIRAAGAQQTEESSWTIDRRSTYAAAGALSRADAEVLLRAVDECLAREDTPFRHGLLSIRHKLEGLGGMTAEPSPLDSEATAQENPAAEALWSAFVLKRKIRFSYLDAKGQESKRTVAVWGVFMQDGHSYFVGLDEQSGGVRTFRDDRIVRAWRPTGRYEVPAWFDIGNYLFLPFDLAAGMAQPVEFSLRRDLSQPEVEALIHGRGELERATDGSWRWRVKARDLNAAASFALAHSAMGMRPVAPNRLVTAWKTLIGKVVETHG